MMYFPFCESVSPSGGCRHAGAQHVAYVTIWAHGVALGVTS
jgi:hypothetical protein